jgi:Fe-S cluster biogenesis protein NfuA
MENNTELFRNISNVIESDIRPYIEADGGRIKLAKVEDDGTVYVQLAGACAGCPGAAMTLKGGVERVLKMKVQGVKEVKLAY